VQSTATIKGVSGSSAISAHAATHRGTVRKLNEDSLLAAGAIYLVADGMGGHNAGDQASDAVRETFDTDFGGVTDAPTTTDVLDAIRRSNNAVRAIATESKALRAMPGTTLAGLALVAAGESGVLHWMAFNIGDSRIYSWDGTSLIQLSVDHSAVQELVEAGKISLDEAAVHPDRNVITRAVGADEVIDADVWLLPAVRQQCFLLCTDGLTKELDDDELSALLAQAETGSDLAGLLVEAAVAAGGSDNVSVVVVESVSTGFDPDLEDTIPKVQLR
jgi:serine/threonine protein phosphatase PrpC